MLLETLKKYKKIIYAIAVSIILLLLISYIIFYVQSCRDKSALDEAYKNRNIAVEEAKNINADIANLEAKKIEALANANIANAEIERLEKERIEKEIEANKSLENINSINNKNFNGSSEEEVNRSRCLAFPDSPECK